MKQERHDIYAYAHKGLRAWMAHTLNELGRLDAHDEAEAERVARGLCELLRALRSHLEHENEFIHPAIEARAPGASRSNGAEHDAHRRAIEALEAATEALAGAAVPERAQAAHQLYRELALFVADNLQHMEYEERELNALLWMHYSDAELRALEQRLVATIEPEILRGSLHWMVPAMAPVERASLLGAMQQRVPRAAFEGLLAELRPALSARDWFKLMLGLAPAPVPAE